MKISIVIPAYNEEKYLADTLKAVCALDYPDFEVIVVDNASTDRTGEIAKGFPVKLVREEKKGLLHARDRGFREASGDIVANIDADCLPPKEWLATAAAAFKDTKVVAVSGPYDYFDGSKFFRSVSLMSQKYMYAPLSDMLQAFGRGGILIGGNNMIRRDVLEKIGGYDTSIVFYGEDTDTAQRVSKEGRVNFTRKVVMPTSARRFKAEGTLRITGLYFYHFLKVVFVKKQKPLQKS